MDLIMKKVLLLIISIIAFSAVSFAQVFNPYPVKDGVETVMKKAKEKGISDPEIFAIASGNMSVQDLGVKVQFMLSSGNANAWIFIVKSKSDAQKRLVLAVTNSMLLGQKIYSAFDVNYDQISEYLPFEPSSSLGSYEWMNSTELYSKISANTNYVNYSTESGNTDPQAILLAVNNLPAYGDNTAYWIMQFPTSANRFICGVQAVTGETRCEYIDNADVKEIAGSEVFIFPNPANEYLSVNTNNLFNGSDLYIDVYDNSGVNVLSNVLNNYNSNTLLLPLSSLSNGSYILKLSNNTYNTSFNFVVSK